jgi:ATP-dependent DNA helicase PIF1
MIDLDEELYSPDLDIPLEKQDVLDCIAARHNVFITGSAGTGKSYLLKLIKEMYDPYGFALTASTGIAAVQIGGVTIHSWAGIGKGDLSREQILENLESYKLTKQRKQMKLARILAIDEISMISADVFELLDYVLRVVRGVDAPFGGIQLIVLGDFLQLPPVGRDGLNNRFCFESHVWKELKMKVCTLKQVYRQHDRKFINLLDNLRLGKLTEEDVAILKSRINIDYSFLPYKPTLITTHNYLAEQANKNELDAISGKIVSFEQQCTGAPEKIMFLQKYCLAPIRLDLKIGAQVMMIRNNYIKNGIINGSIGVVQDFTSRDIPIVEFDNNIRLKIQPSEWEYTEFNSNTMKHEVKAVIRQLPLIHAWSITVHKAQGMSIDAILCDLGRLFEQGQGYVALSRAKSLSGLFIKSFDFNKITVSPEAVEFYNSLVSK